LNNNRAELAELAELWGTLIAFYPWTFLQVTEEDPSVQISVRTAKGKNA
jgi:hypothetical protein